jgi:hypothetical protein
VTDIRENKVKKLKKLRNRDEDLQGEQKSRIRCSF